jgi:hypothetical protein
LRKEKRKEKKRKVLHVLGTLDALRREVGGNQEPSYGEKRKEKKRKLLHVLGTLDALRREVGGDPNSYTSVIVRHPYCQSVSKETYVSVKRDLL